MSTASGATRNLVMATIGFTVNFWAWALLGPLAPGIKERLGLSFAAQSLLVAVPVLVGSLGRIPVGALTDRIGARLMFPIVSLLTIVPVLTLTRNGPATAMRSNAPVAACRPSGGPGSRLLASAPPAISAAAAIDRMVLYILLVLQLRPGLA